MSVACFSPVIWVSISPCICNESTKILRLPMKRAQAIPLYGWQNPSSSKSSLRHTEKQRRVHRNLKFWGFFFYRYFNSIKTEGISARSARWLLQTVTDAAIPTNSTRGQSMFENDTKPTSCTSVDGKGCFLLLVLNQEVSQINHIQVKGKTHPISQQCERCKPHWELMFDYLTLVLFIAEM